MVHAINEAGSSGQAHVPVTVSAHWAVLAGLLIAQDAYFAQLAEGSPMFSALQPASGLLGKEYASDVTADADHHLHIRAAMGGEERLWRVRLETVDGWALGAVTADGRDDKGPFARLLGA